MFVGVVRFPRPLTMLLRILRLLQERGELGSAPALTRARHA